MEDADLRGNSLAVALRVPANRLTEILNGRRAITADTAMRLGRYFGTSAQMWMNLQARYDLEAAEEKLAERIDLEVQPMDGRPTRTRHLQPRSRQVALIAALSQRDRRQSSSAK